MHRTSTAMAVCSFLLLVVSRTRAVDCYKYGISEFTTIVECDQGCEYVFRKRASEERRLSGGCAGDGAVGCRSRKDSVTVCVCKGDYCNARGYGMKEDSRSEEH